MLPPGERHTAQFGRVSGIGPISTGGGLARANEIMTNADRAGMRMLYKGPSHAVLVSEGYTAVTLFGASRVRKVGRKPRLEEVGRLPTEVEG